MSCPEKVISIKNKSIIQTFKVFQGKLAGSEIQNIFTGNKLRNKEEFCIRLAQSSIRKLSQENQKLLKRNQK